MTRILSVDVGTSALKVAVFENGERIAQRRARLPALDVAGDRVTQPLRALVEIVESVVAEVAQETSPDRIAITSQRDTAIALGEDRATDLISWRDRRHVRAGSIWAALHEAGELPSRGLRIRSIASHLAERWTGRAAESDGTLPHHQRAIAREHLRERFDHADIPEVSRVGAVAGTTRDCVLPADLPLHLTAGDKNAELLGAGVIAAGMAGLSLGSSISLGVMTDEVPPAVEGRVVSVAAVPGRWNAETGLITGMTVLDHLCTLTNRSDLVPDDVWRPNLWYVPLQAGALDSVCSTGVIAGISATTSPEDLARAWAQGVACELARLAPTLLDVAGRVTEVRVYGGGANGVWCRLLADTLGVRVLVLDDPWRGARGAAMSVLYHLGDDAAATALRESHTASFEPDAGRRDFITRYRAHYERLVYAGVA